MTQSGCTGMRGLVFTVIIVTQINSLLSRIDIGKKKIPVVDGKCFEDNLKTVPHKVLPARAYFSTKNTIDTCKKACFDLNYRFAGVTYSKTCMCGNNAPLKAASKQSDCNIECSGDKSQKCGGNNVIKVYQNPGAIIRTYLLCVVLFNMHISDIYTTLFSSQRSSSRVLMGGNSTITLRNVTRS